MKKLVIFDFDGVLVNTIDLSFQINQKTNPNLTFDEYSSMSNGNFYECMENGSSPFIFNPNPTYHEEYHDGIRSFDIPTELKEVLIKLKDDYRLAIVSSGSEKAISHFLEKEGLRELFSDVLGYETHKSKVKKFQKLLDDHDIHHTNSVFITDTLGDLLEAHQVNIKSVAVLWGMHDENKLRQGNPEKIISNMNLLESMIQEIIK